MLTKHRLFYPFARQQVAVDIVQHISPRVITLPRSPRDEAIDVLTRASLGRLDDYEIPKMQGIHSIVLFPKHNPDEVLKIPLGNYTLASFIHEISILKKIKQLDIKSVDVVELRRIGYDPNYIIMNRLGPSLTEIWETSGAPGKSEIREIGRMLADFTVELYKKTGGMIHKDLHYENLTRQPNGRYGCIDFGDCGFEEMEAAFVQVAVRDIPIISFISERIYELTGTALDLEKLRHKALAWIETQK